MVGEDAEVSDLMLARGRDESDESGEEAMRLEVDVRGAGAGDLLARTGSEVVSHTEHCDKAVLGQLHNYIRERDGRPLLEPDQLEPFEKRRHASWAKRQRKAE